MTTTRSTSARVGIALATTLVAIVPIANAATAPVPPAETTAAPTPVEAPAPTTTLDRIRSTGKLMLGYLVDGRPFAYRDEGGSAAGYAVALCEKIARQLGGEPGLSAVTVQWMPLETATALTAVQRGTVDLLCAGSRASLSARRDVAFSTPIFPGGIGAVLRVDSSERLQALLEERRPPYQPLWRGTAPPTIQRRTFSAIEGTPALDWLEARIDTFKLAATTTPVDGYEAGVARVLAGDSDVFFGERAQLLDAVTRNRSAGDLVVLKRHFTYEPLALAIARNDDDFRTSVDRALNRIYAAPEFGALYTATFGKPDPDTVEFFRQSVAPE